MAADVVAVVAVVAAGARMTADAGEIAAAKAVPIARAARM
tara:strand:- start:1992 stop:2111 length:120 start_codon:yes stop_codon:yes gene_type:complete